MTSVTFLMNGCKVLFIAAAMAFIAPSTADISSRNEPPSPASIFWAVSAATPSTSINFANIASNSSVFAVKVRPAKEPRISKMSSAKASFSAVGIVCITLAMSRMISAILRKLPFASSVSTPTARSCSCTLTLANWLKLLRRAVPASEPLMPILARTASAAHVSLTLSPAAAACGPPIFNASKRSVKVWADEFAVTVKTSEMSPIFSASSPKIRRELAAISPASDKSVPVARAKFKTSAIAAWISLGENPMRPRATIASATCWAV